MLVVDQLFCSIPVVVRRSKMAALRLPHGVSALPDALLAVRRFLVALVVRVWFVGHEHNTFGRSCKREVRDANGPVSRCRQTRGKKGRLAITH